jgi:hypothetical protein
MGVTLVSPFCPSHCHYFARLFCPGGIQLRRKAAGWFPKPFEVPFRSAPQQRDQRCVDAFSLCRAAVSRSEISTSIPLNYK